MDRPHLQCTYIHIYIYKYTSIYFHPSQGTGPSWGWFSSVCTSLATLYFYTDNSHLYLLLRSRDFLHPLLDCLEAIKSWMANSFLQFNIDKTKSSFGPSKTRSCLTNKVGHLIPYLKSYAKILGVILDNSALTNKSILS